MVTFILKKQMLLLYSDSTCLACYRLSKISYWLPTTSAYFDAIVQTTIEIEK